MGLRKKFDNESQIREWILDNIPLLKKLYLKKDMTARKVAENQNVTFDKRIPKLFHRILGSKGRGLGGSRLGSGNKKGIKFCGNCRQQPQNCTC